ncbi:MAG: hypothetical protein AB9880_04420 [Christensenellales bacterium]
MQNKPSNRSKREKALVFKPFLMGSWLSWFAARRGLKLLAYQMAFVFVYLFIGQALLFDSLYLRLASNLLVVLGFSALMYNDGAKAGLDDVAFAEIALQRQNQGKTAGKAELDRCFHPAKGFFTVLAGMAPLVLLCAVFAVIAQVQVYQLGALPSWLQPYERRADVGLALGYYRQSQAFGLTDGLRIAVRLIIFPYINMAGSGSRSTLLLLERLSPLLALIIPTGYALGYLQGKRLRAGIHGAISSDARRRVQRQRREKRRLQRQEPNNLV